MIEFHWILDDRGRPVRVPWSEWQLQDVEERRVASEEVGGYWVSTIFLGIDHSHGGSIPILWETMVFGDGSSDLDMERCGGSRDQAEEMHRRVCTRVRGALGIPEPEEAEWPGQS